MKLHNRYLLVEKAKNDLDQKLNSWLTSMLEKPDGSQMTLAETIYVITVVFVATARDLQNQKIKHEREDEDEQG